MCSNIYMPYLEIDYNTLNITVSELSNQVYMSLAYWLC